MEIPVVIPSGGDNIIADLSTVGPNAVLVLPGWGGTRYGPQRILVQAAQAFSAAGHTTLRLDYRGRGDSSGNASEATLDSMIEDAVTAVNWLREKQSAERIQLVGLCSGGNVALGAASLLPDIVDHIVCWSLLPFMEHKKIIARKGTDRKSLLRQMLLKSLHPDSWRKLLRGEANFKGAMGVLSKDKEGDADEKIRKTSNRDILGNMEAFAGKLHLLFGDNDPEAEGSQAFYAAWCKRNDITADVCVILGAPHNFYTARWTQDVIEQTTKWLDS